MDVMVQNEGSILILHPRSDRGRQWVEEHIGPNNGYQPQWPDVLVEARYVDAIIEGMRADGLEVR